MFNQRLTLTDGVCHGQSSGEGFQLQAVGLRGRASGGRSAEAGRGAGGGQLQAGQSRHVPGAGDGSAGAVLPRGERPVRPAADPAGADLRVGPAQESGFSQEKPGAGVGVRRFLPAGGEADRHHLPRQHGQGGDASQPDQPAEAGEVLRLSAGRILPAGRQDLAPGGHPEQGQELLRGGRGRLLP